MRCVSCARSARQARGIVCVSIMRGRRCAAIAASSIGKRATAASPPTKPRSPRARSANLRGRVKRSGVCRNGAARSCLLRRRGCRCRCQRYRRYRHARRRYDPRQRPEARAVERAFAQRRRTDAHWRSPDAPSRTLKNLFQERGIPAWKRDVPLLFIGDELLFVPLLGVNRAVAAGVGESRRSARQNRLARGSADRLTGRSDSRPTSRRNRQNRAQSRTRTSLCSRNSAHSMAILACLFALNRVR